MQMHSRTVLSKNRLRHKGGAESEFLCNNLGNKPKCSNIISSSQSVRILKVNLMLTGGHFMMGGLNLKTHSFKGQDNLPPGFLSPVQRSQIKITGLIMHFDHRVSLFIGFKEEKLRLRPDL